MTDYGTGNELTSEAAEELLGKAADITAKHPDTGRPVTFRGAYVIGLLENHGLGLMLNEDLDAEGDRYTDGEEFYVPLAEILGVDGVHDDEDARCAYHIESMTCTLE
jgi:hypothetical protein